MTILVTGASGFIGRHVVAHLRAAGEDVRATGRAARFPVEMAATRRVAYVEGDLGNLLPDVLRGVHEVWHLAANADPYAGTTDRELDLRSSTVLTWQLLEGMLLHGVERLVFPSSGSVYGISDRDTDRAATEDLGPRPRSPYAAGKVACEALICAYCASFDLQARVFRLGSVIGSGMRRGLIWDTIGKLLRDRNEVRLRGGGRQRRSYVHVADAVRGMHELSRGTGADYDIYNLGGTTSLAASEVAKLVAITIGEHASRIVSDGSPTVPGDIPEMRLSIAKATAAGWRPTEDARTAVQHAAAALHVDVSRIITSVRRGS